LVSGQRPTATDRARHQSARMVIASELDRAASTWFPHILEDAEDASRRPHLRNMRFRHDRLEIECIILKRSKHLIDVIDQNLAKAFGFTEEVDFIINYDIKYRMGGTDEGDAL
jgi:hypothetical protein